MQDVAANWLYDAFKKLTCLRLKQCTTKEQRADIFTKAFPLASSWYEACSKINIDASTFLHAQPKKALVVTTYRHPGVTPLQDAQVLYRFFNPISPADNHWTWDKSILHCTCLNLSSANQKQHARTQRFRSHFRSCLNCQGVSLLSSTHSISQLDLFAG